MEMTLRKALPLITLMVLGLAAPMAPAMNGGDDDPPAEEVTLSTSVSGDAVSLSWEVSGIDVRDQEVYRNTQAALDGRTRIGSVDASARSFTDSGVAAGRYYYSIKVRNIDMEWTNSNAARAVVEDNDGGGGVDAEVYNNGGTWYATNGNSTVYAGNDMMDAMQAAVDSLTPGRTSKETVVVRGDGTVGPHSWDGDVKSVDLPSYTILDVQGTIRVADSGEDLIVPIRAQNAQSIEIRNLRVEGNPRYGVWLQSVSDVHLGNIEMYLGETETVGLGVRIDDSRGSRSTDISLDYAYVQGSAHHGVETYGVDDITIGHVETVDTGGSGLILNDTTNATVDLVEATRPDVGGGYAGFRMANGAGPGISVAQVTVREGARGFFCVSGSHGAAIDNVDIEGTEVQGILIQDCQDVTVNGGIVRNTFNEGVRIASRSSADHAPASNVTIRNLRVVDDRWNRQQTYGIRETAAGGTNSNRIVNNDLRNAGTTADLVTEGPGTTVYGNRLTGQ